MCQEPILRREKNAKVKTAWLKFSRSLSGKHFVRKAPENNRSNEGNIMRITATAVLLLLTLGMLAQAEPRQ